jgi:hypothetical protein
MFKSSCCHQAQNNKPTKPTWHFSTSPRASAIFDSARRAGGWSGLTDSTSRYGSWPCGLRRVFLGGVCGVHASEWCMGEGLHVRQRKLC